MSAFDQSETSDSEYPQNPPLQDVSAEDEALLREIREKFRYFDDRWKESRDERNKDLRYVCGDPWEAKDRRAREEAGRPCVSHDEINQFTNACVNSVRENKRGIKISPGGKNSNDQTAETRQNLIRAIEYRSNGPSVYLTAFQQMVEGSYGFFRIGREYVAPDDPDNDDQQITISAIGNPNSVLYDPDCKKPDWSDASAVFVLDPMLKADFKRQFPDAQITDFAPEHMLLAKDWIQDKSVLTAEYWKVITTTIRKKAKGRRAVEKKTVMQYFTNGVEILERNPQPGTHIPVIPMIGLERWVDEGGIAKRILFSLPRLARDPQMSLAYLNSQEMEEAGLTPKSPYKGYVGQFETDKEAWDTCTKIPHAYLQADVVIDGATGGVLPLPSRENFTPNFAAYEVAKDSCRRAIQAAMGISPLPTAAQRDNQKSGVALQEVKQQQEIGSFHFVDGYDRAVAYGGRVIDSWVASTYGGDTERTEALRKPDDSHDIVRLNTAEPYLDQQSGEMRHYPIEEDADHDVAVSTGPSVQTQQQAASDFLDLLIQNLQTLPVAPPQAAKLLALAIQMKELGPKGDEMADIISPPANQAQAGQQAAQQQAQMQQQGELLQAMQGELQKLQLEKAGHVVDNEYKMQIEKMREENALAIAEINTQAQNLSERMEFVSDLAHKYLDTGHEVATQAQDHANAQSLQQQAQAHAAGLQGSDQAHSAVLQQGAQAHATDQQASAQDATAQQAAQAQQAPDTP